MVKRFSTVYLIFVAFFATVVFFSHGLINFKIFSAIVVVEVGLIPLCFNWLLLYFAISLSIRRSRQYGNLRYLELLSVIDVEPALCRSDRIRFILIGSYRVMLRVLRSELEGLKSIELSDLFIKCQLAIQIGEMRERRLVSHVADIVLQAIRDPNPQFTAMRRVTAAISLARDSLEQRFTPSELGFEMKWPVSWTDRLGKSLPGYASFVIKLAPYVTVAIIAIIMKYLFGISITTT